MTATAIEVRKIDLRAASDREYEALTDFWNAIRFEREPDEPSISLEERKANWHNMPAIHVNHTFTVWSGDGRRIIAAAEVDYRNMEENKHLLDFGVFVLPPYRRGGLGRELLRHVTAVAESEGRRLMLTGSNDRVPSGDAFLRRIGAEPGLDSHVNVLKVAELDRGLMQSWIDRAPERASAYDIAFWGGPYPDDRLAAVAKLHTVMNTAPRGQLDIEDEEFSPEHFRDWERQMFASGEHRYTAWVTERATGEFVGFSELFWNPNRPLTLGQGATGVFPAHRDRGIGRWVKAANLLRVLDVHPEVTKVRTGNADSNKAMLGINYAMGFKPDIAWIWWQVPTEKVRAYLNTRK